ncbi:MAG: hypothetical protein E5V27_27840, partial [Mesorhizobium sp.]
MILKQHDDDAGYIERHLKSDDRHSGRRRKQRANQERQAYGQHDEYGVARGRCVAGRHHADDACDIQGSQHGERHIPADDAAIAAEAE